MTGGVGEENDRRVGVALAGLSTEFSTGSNSGIRGNGPENAIHHRRGRTLIA